MICYYNRRYPCPDCEQKFTTGRARDQHRPQCGRPQPPAKRRRTDGAGPSNQNPEGTRAALDGLFKMIDLKITSTSPAVMETLQNEAERLADILR